MEKPLTSTSHALLGLLSLRPWTTYELAKQVQRSLGWFWPRAERKLYDEPKRLVAAGLATATDEVVGKRPRTVYSITPAGRKELRRWLGEPSASPTLEFEAMVRVFFADSGSLTQLRSTLEQIRRESAERGAELRSMIESGSDDDYEFGHRWPVNALALRFEIDHQALLGEWAGWALRQIEDWSSTTDAAGWDWAAAMR